MKAKVDEDLCIGCELCVDTCPEVFQMNDDGFAEAIVDPVPSEAEDCAREAGDICPVTAIEIEE
jgi:ferredoxin